MDIVILVKSCARDRDRGIHNVIRDTWGGWTELADVRFVLGDGNTDPLPDEIVLPARDGYDYLWEKTREANHWALGHNYRHAFHCCTDTYVVVPRLVALCKIVGHYVGCATGEGHPSGGAGYLLNEPAMFQLANSRWYPGWEDKVVFELLAKACIHPVSLPVFRGSEPQPWDTKTVSVHLGTRTGSLTPEMIYDCDCRFLKAHSDDC